MSKKFKYILFRGMEKIEVAADSIGIELPKVGYVELTYRKSDDEISLSTSGEMIIEPRASNVIRVRTKK